MLLLPSVPTRKTSRSWAVECPGVGLRGSGDNLGKSGRPDRSPASAPSGQLPVGAAGPEGACPCARVLGFWGRKWCLWTGASVPFGSRWWSSGRWACAWLGSAGHFPQPRPLSVQSLAPPPPPLTSSPGTSQGFSMRGDRTHPDKPWAVVSPIVTFARRRQLRFEARLNPRSPESGLFSPRKRLRPPNTSGKRESCLFTLKRQVSRALAPRAVGVEGAVGRPEQQCPVICRPAVLRVTATPMPLARAAPRGRTVTSKGQPPGITGTQWTCGGGDK